MDEFNQSKQSYLCFDSGYTFFACPWIFNATLDFDICETDFQSDIFEVVEKEYIGLWQWCFKHYGCFDLSLLAKEFSIYTKIINNKNRNGILDMIINKVNRIINLWTVSRSCATVAVICAISVSI